MSTLDEHIEALVQDPTSEEKAAAVRDLARQEIEPVKYAEAFAARGRALAESESVDLAVASLAEAALVYEEELEKLSEAAELWEEVLRLQSGHRRALFTLGLLLHDLNRWDDLIALYRRRLETSSDAKEQTTLHLYIAELLSERKEDDAGAFDEVLRAARLMPSNLRIISRVQHLGERTDRLDEVAVTIGDLLVQQDDPRLRAALSLRLAELHLGPLGDEKRALAYLRAALMDDGANPEILSEMADVFREQHRFDALAEVLEEAATDRRVGPHRVRLERELARIYEHELDDLPRALSALGRAVRQTPEDRELLDEILRLGTIADRMELVADAYEHVVETTDNPLLRTYMRLKLGYIYADKLGRLDDAARVFSAILDAEPSHEEAQQRLNRLREKGAEAGEEADGERPPSPYTGDIELPSDAAFADLSEALETLQEEEGLEPEAEPAAEESPSDTPVEDPLASVPRSAVFSGRADDPTEFEGEGFGPETETVMAAQSPGVLVNDPVATGLLSPSSPSEDEPSVASSPVASSPVASSSDASSPAASSPDASSPVASSPVASSPDASSSDASSVASSPAASSPAAEESAVSEGADDLSARPAEAPAPEGPEEEVLEVLTTDVESFEAETSSPSVMVPAGPVVSEPPEAFEAAEAEPPPEAEGVPEGSPDNEASPGDVSTADVAEILAAERHTPSGLMAALSLDDPSLSFATIAADAVAPEQHGLLDRFDLLRRDLSDAIQTDDRVRIIHRLAGLTELFEELGQPQPAFLTAVRLAEVAPREEHLQEVLRLGRTIKDYPLMFSTIETTSASLGVEHEIHFNLLLADVEIEDQRNLAAAITRFEGLAERFPENEALLGRWLTVLDKEDQPQAMADLLIRRSLREDDPRLAFPFVQRAMALLEERLEAPGRATDELLRFVDRSAGYTVARDQLEARMLDEARFEELAEVIARELDRADGDARIQKYLQLSDVIGHSIGRLDEAEALLNRGLDERPGSVELLAGLRRVAESSGQWQDVLSIGQRQLDNEPDARARIALRRRLAEVAEMHIDDPELAQELLATAIDESSEDRDLLDHLLRLQTAQHNWSGALETLRRISETTDEAEVRAHVALEEARIVAEEYRDLPAAMRAVSRALTEVPNHLPALSQAVDLAEAGGDYDEALRVLKQWASIVDGVDAADVHARRGRLLESAFEDLPGAARAYDSALLADVNHGPARRALLRLAETQGDYVRAFQLATEAAERATDPRDAALFWTHAGRLAQDGVGDDLEALRCYERALAEDPEDLATTALVGELLLARRAYSEAYPHLDKAADGLSDPDRSAELYGAAAIAAHHLDMPEAATKAYESVLALRPDDRIALDQLGQYLEQNGEWGRVHDLGAHLLLRHEEALAPAERAQVYLRMARARLAEDDAEAAVRLAKRADALHESEAILEVLAEALDRAGHPFDAADCLKRLAPMRGDDASRRATLIRAGRMLGERGVDLARAAALLAEAQVLSPADLEVAELLCAYRRSLGDPRQAANALRVPCQHLHGRPKANLLVRAARVLIEGDVARPEARRWLSQAVTLIPTHADALADLRVILAFDGEYATLTQVQARAAEAFLEDPGTEVDAGDDGRTKAAEALLRSNLDLYRFRLDSPQRALTCCQRLLSLYPEDAPLEETRAHLLAQLVVRRPEPQVLDEAVRAWSRALERRPGDPELIQRVASLRRKAGQARASALLGELSSALGLGTAESLPAVSEDPNVPRLSIKPSSGEAESPASWLERLGYAPLVAFADALPEPRPRKRDLVNLGSLPDEVARPFAYAAARLGMDAPPVYVREDLDTPVRPTWVGNGPALMLAPDVGDLYPAAVVRFLLGRALGLLRGRALALVVTPLDVLREGLIGFVKTADPTTYLADPKTTKRRGRALERAVPASERQALLDELTAWLEDPKRRSLAEEREAVLRTADRAGLMVAGSLHASLQGLQVLSDGRIERSWRVPLLEYAASEACAELMERLT